MEWIKCSERLPEDEGNYIVTNALGNVCECSYVEGWNCFRRTDGIVFRNYECEDGFIVAWMPMPDAYGKEY